MFNTSRRLMFGRTVGVIGGLAAVHALNTFHPLQLENLKSVVVDKSIDAFPIKLNDFSLLGQGVRSVTFLGFKVYGVGVYIQDKSRNTVKALINDDIDKLSADESTELISKVWEATEFKVRISPVRNTDFSHLKDGFIKSILSNPLSKNNSKVAEGLDEIRAIFKGHRGSVPKNHVLLLETTNGKLTFTYQDLKGNSKVLGTVNEPLVSKLLMISYLSSRKPLSEPLRKSCVEGFKNL